MLRTAPSPPTTAAPTTHVSTTPSSSRTVQTPGSNSSTTTQLLLPSLNGNDSAYIFFIYIYRRYIYVTLLPLVAASSFRSVPFLPFLSLPFIPLSKTFPFSSHSIIIHSYFIYILFIIVSKHFWASAFAARTVRCAGTRPSRWCRSSAPALCHATCECTQTRKAVPSLLTLPAQSASLTTTTTLSLSSTSRSSSPPSSTSTRTTPCSSQTATWWWPPGPRAESRTGSSCQPKKSCKQV